MTTRIERAKAELVEVRRLLRNVQARMRRRSMRLYIRPTQCHSCGQQKGAWVHNEPTYSEYQALSEKQGKLWYRQWQLGEYITACELVDKGYPKK